MSGLSGVIPMLTKATEVFHDNEKLVERCIKAVDLLGEVTWGQGLVFKTGLVDGIIGNGYLLHRIYRMYNNLAQGMRIRKR